MWLIAGDSAYNLKHIKKIEYSNNALSKNFNTVVLYFSENNTGLIIRVGKDKKITDFINKVEELNKEYTVMDIEDFTEHLKT